MTKTLFDHRAKLLKEHYARIWYTEPHKIKVRAPVSMAEFEVVHEFDTTEGKQARQQLLALAENDYLVPIYYDGYNEPITRLLFVVNSADPRKLVLHWLKYDKPDLRAFYSREVTEAEEAGYKVMACIPHVQDLAFCTLSVVTRANIGLFIHFDDGGYRIGFHADWQLLPALNPTLIGVDELPHDDEIPALFDL